MKKRVTKKTRILTLGLVTTGLAGCLVLALVVSAATAAPQNNWRIPTGPSYQGPQGIPLYDSLTPPGVYSQAFNGPQVTQFGQAINLTTNWAGAALDTVTVGMANFGPTAFSTPVTFNIYNIGTGGVVGSLIATDTESVAVPNNDNTGVGVTTFTATFRFRNVLLPTTVVYGVTLDGLASDCASTPADCGNDPNPVGSLNVTLAPNVSEGSNVYPGDVYVSSLQSDTSGTALASDLGACPGAPSGVLTTFQGVPVSCSAGYGSNVDGLGVDITPAVEFTAVG